MRGSPTPKSTVKTSRLASPLFSCWHRCIARESHVARANHEQQPDLRFGGEPCVTCFSAHVCAQEPQVACLSVQPMQVKPLYRSTAVSRVCCVQSKDDVVEFSFCRSSRYNMPFSAYVSMGMPCSWLSTRCALAATAFAPPSVGCNCRV